MVTNYRIVACAFFIAAALFAAPPACAANDIQPGLWQDTETGDVNGKPMPPKVSSECVSVEEAKDIAKRAQAELQKSMKEQAQQCSQLAIKETGNTILFEMKCGDPKQGAIDVTSVITIQSSQHTTNVTKSTMSFMGQKIVSNLTTDSKWVAAACKK
jgi:hypothetical protein